MLCRCREAQGTGKASRTRKRCDFRPLNDPGRPAHRRASLDHPGYNGRVPASPRIDPRDAPPMPLKIANIRLGLDEPEDALPEKIASRLGIGREAISALADLAQEPRRPPPRRDPLRLRRGGRNPRRRGRPGGGSGCRPVRPRAVRLARAGVRGARASADRDRVGPGGAIRGVLPGDGGYRPLVLERGREVKDRVADVRAFDDGGLIDPESNYLFGEGGAGTFSDGKLTSRGGGPDVQARAGGARRLPRQAVDPLRASPAPRLQPPPPGRADPAPEAGATRRRGQVLVPRRGPRDRPKDASRACSPARAASRPTRPSWPSATARATRMGCSSVEGCRWRPRRSSSACGSSSRRGRSTRPATAASAGHPALGAADYELVAKAGGRDLFTFCMCAGGYVMPSVSEPGYFCTNGMSESRHDSPFANSGLVVTITPEDTGSTHPLAGVHYQQRAERLAYLAGGRSYAAPIQRARDFLADRPSRGKVPSSYPRGVAPTDLGLILPPLVLETPGTRPADPRPPLPRPLPQGRDPDRPRVAREFARPHPARRRDPREPRRRRAVPLRRRGRLRRAGSSARPSMACAPPGRWWRATPCRSRRTPTPPHASPPALAAWPDAPSCASGTAPASVSRNGARSRWTSCETSPNPAPAKSSRTSASPSRDAPPPRTPPRRRHR